MITASGAKLLDFGLAKRQQAGQPIAPSASSLPTEASQLTLPGTILVRAEALSPSVTISAIRVLASRVAHS